MTYYIGAFFVGFGVLLLAVFLVSVLWLAAQAVSKWFPFISRNEDFNGFLAAVGICVLATCVGLLVLRAV